MNKKTKFSIGFGVVILVIASLVISNNGLFQGRTDKIKLTANLCAKAKLKCDAEKLKISAKKPACDIYAKIERACLPLLPPEKPNNATPPPQPPPPPPPPPPQEQDDLVVSVDPNFAAGRLSGDGLDIQTAFRFILENRTEEEIVLDQINFGFHGNGRGLNQTIVRDQNGERVPSNVFPQGVVVDDARLDFARNDRRYIGYMIPARQTVTMEVAVQFLNRIGFNDVLDGQRIQFSIDNATYIIARKNRGDGPAARIGGNFPLQGPEMTVSRRGYTVRLSNDQPPLSVPASDNVGLGNFDFIAWSGGDLRLELFDYTLDIPSIDIYRPRGYIDIDKTLTIGDQVYSVVDYNHPIQIRAGETLRISFTMNITEEFRARYNADYPNESTLPVRIRLGGDFVPSAFLTDPNLIGRVHEAVTGPRIEVDMR